MSVTNIHDSSSAAARRSARRGVRAASTQGASDAELVELVRNGDPSAFGELWNRHSAAGVAAARSITSRFDPEDLSAEAFTRILQAIKDGKGPRVAFRPYLYTSIRNISINWARDRGQEIPSEEVNEFAALGNTEDEALAQLERSTSNRAYNSLPTRWQEALWYSEVEGLSPRHIAPLLGMKAGAVSALLFRARAGLREAWIQVHLTTLSAESECRWVVGNLAASTRSTLGKRDQQRVNAHLSGCASCTLVAGEADHLNKRLALVLLPLAIGVTGTAAFTAWLQSGAAATAVAAAVPTSLAGAAGTVSGGAKAGATVSMPAVAAAAAAVVVSASAIFGVSQLLNSGEGSEPPGVTVAAPAVQDPAAPSEPAAPAPPVAPPAVPAPSPEPAPRAEEAVVSPRPAPAPAPIVPPVVVPPVIDPPVVEPIIPPVDAATTAPTVVLGSRDPGRGPSAIEGNAGPGASVIVFRDGVELGTVAADKSGGWRLDLPTEIDPGTYRFTAVQRDVAGNVSPASESIEVTVYGLRMADPGWFDTFDEYTLGVQGEPGALVTIHGADSSGASILITDVTIDESGSWVGHPVGTAPTSGWTRFVAQYSQTVEPALVSNVVQLFII